MRDYRDFDLELTDAARDGAGEESLVVRVAASPAGEQRRADAVRVAFGPELRRQCGRLDRRELDLAGLVALGRELGELLLPEGVRGFYERSRPLLGEGEGLRLRLKLDTWGVADLPWEFAWVAPAAGGPAPEAAGFLALDPRLSIVRYELLAEPLGALEPTGAKKLRVVALLAAPRDPRWAPLDLEGEARGLREALASRREIALEVVEPATLGHLERALLDGAQVFHFAGHGRFQAAPEERIDTVAGKGYLVLREEDGRAREVPAESVLVNLRGRDVRLAVLGACEGARRDRVNPWTGIAPALVRGGLPAVVAMQATLYDRSAVAFGTRFYEALARGLPVDAAVAAGRIAIFNAGGAGERDWGVPVLYLRAESGVLFPRPAEEAEGGEPLEPLGRRGWLNAALAALALGAAAAAFHAWAQPRFAARWLWGAGLSVAGIGGLLLAWLQWLAGEEARAWARRGLRHARATWAVGAAALLLAGAAAWVAAQRPAVLRVVPGTKLTARLLRPGVVHTLRIWQGEAGAQPAWVVRPFTPSGAAVGASERVLKLALSRSRTPLEGAMRSYLEERVPCPEETPEECARKRDGWMARWRLAEPDPEGSTGPRRRRGRPLRFELLRDGETVDVLPVEVELLEEVEDDVELLFVEPAPNP